MEGQKSVNRHRYVEQSDDLADGSCPAERHFDYAMGAACAPIV
jgi:hypothetical protein